MQAWLGRVRAAVQRPDHSPSPAAQPDETTPVAFNDRQRSARAEPTTTSDEKSQVSGSAATGTGWNWFKRKDAKPRSSTGKDETSSEGSAPKLRSQASSSPDPPGRETPPPAYAPPKAKPSASGWKLWSSGPAKKTSATRPRLWTSGPPRTGLPTTRPLLSAPPRFQSAGPPIAPPAPFRSAQSGNAKARLRLPKRGQTGPAKLQALPAGLPKPKGPPRSKLLATLTALTFPPPADVVNTIQREPFDPLHDLDSRFRASVHKRHRTCCDLCFIIILVTILLSIFLAFPVTVYMIKYISEVKASAATIGPNGFKEVPLDNIRDLIDPDTPANAQSRTGYDGQAYQLVFSDEFNVDGRQVLTFYKGDDPYWQAEDIWAGNSNDLQWYDPGQVETKDGSLVITMEERKVHNLSYVSGMVTGWNKLCFTGAYVEVSVSLPGDTSTPGLWPAAWMLGNLGRAGYGATLDGLWPYSYDSCDVGTLPNQTMPGNEKLVPNSLSGQRLSACTCPDDDHPGPKNGDRWTGRGSPELDIMEGYIDTTNGPTLSTGLPVSPFDEQMQFVQNSDTFAVYKSQYSPSFAGFGGTSAAEYAVVRSKMPKNIYEKSGKQFQVFGLEWQPGYTGEGSLTWSQGGEQSWKITSEAYPASSKMGIGARPISSEPSYLILNLAMSTNFHEVEADQISFPAHYLVDYYQRTDMVDVTCEPTRAPTNDYINRHADAYGTATNNTWSQVRSANGKWPRNSLTDSCS